MGGTVSRRLFLRSAAGGAAGMAGWSMLSAQTPAASAAENGSVATSETGIAPASGNTAKVVSSGAGWRFGRAVDGCDQPGFDDSDLATTADRRAHDPAGASGWELSRIRMSVPESGSPTST